MKKNLYWFYCTYCDKTICLASFYKEIKILMRDNAFGIYRCRTLTEKQIEYLLEEFPFIINNNK